MEWKKRSCVVERYYFRKTHMNEKKHRVWTNNTLQEAKKKHLCASDRFLTKWNIRLIKSYSLFQLSTEHRKMHTLLLSLSYTICRNPTLKECEDDTHTPEMGTWESSETFENSKLDCRGQNTLPWGVLYTVEKVLKHRCRKWPCMGLSNIYNTSYVRKKVWESNWQFDS
jgi:hypothetical protein